jgi:DUF2933 family protein
MRRQQWGLYTIALAILIVGLVALGVPASTLLVAGLVLVCPLMMLVMMRGMHGGDRSVQHDWHEWHSTPPGPQQHEEHHGAGRR